MSETQKVVLTGSNGFLGSHLAEYLVNKGYDVHCIVRKSSNLKYIEHLPITFHTCGLTDINELKKVLKNVHYIFHLAGTVAALNYEDYIYGNVTVSQNLLEATLTENQNLKKIVVTSSLAVGGPSTKENPIDETNGFNPVSLYGKAKVEQEKVCMQYMDRLPITIARPSVISGEREAELYEFIKTIKQGLVPLVGFKEKYVGIINVKDLTEAFYQMAISDKTNGEAYYLSSEEIISWKELAKFCAEKLNKKPIYLHLPNFIIYIAGFFASLAGKLKGKATTFDLEKAKEGVQEAWICKIEKAKKDFGYKETVPLKEGVAKAIEWYKGNGWL